MSSLFNRKKVLKGIKFVNKLGHMLIALDKVTTAGAKIVIKLTDNADFQVEFCNSLELICKTVEDRAIGLYDHYKNSVEDEVTEMLAAFENYKEVLEDIDADKTETEQ